MNTEKYIQQINEFYKKSKLKNGEQIKSVAQINSTMESQVVPDLINEEMQQEKTEQNKPKVEQKPISPNEELARLQRELDEYWGIDIDFELPFSEIENNETENENQNNELENEPEKPQFNDTSSETDPAVNYDDYLKIIESI